MENIRVKLKLNLNPEIELSASDLNYNSKQLREMSSSEIEEKIKSYLSYAPKELMPPVWLVESFETFKTKY